jgi:hypothetical protein
MKENAIALEEYRDFITRIYAYVVWGDGEYFLVMHNDLTGQIVTVVRENAAP